MVLDDLSTDGTVDALKSINDLRIRVSQNKECNGTLKDGVIQNRYRLLEMCDGQFAFHLNDRDLIDTEGMADLIAFLKDHPAVTGGLCNMGGDKLLDSPEECFMSIPYFGSHPTGIVFNIDEYRLIQNRQELFTRGAEYIHSHDLILGQLSGYGEMFQFKKIWSLAGTESFASNKSFCTKKVPSKMRGFRRKRELKNSACLSSGLQRVLLTWN